MLNSSSAPQLNTPSSYSALVATDWSFAKSDTRSETHGIHPYPAKFIPQIPRALIAALHPGDGSAVLDPFCGSGTTLVEALRAGAPAVGIDLHPLACLISKVKVTPLRRSLVLAAQEALSRASDAPTTIPDIPALDHWFEGTIQLELASLFSAVEDERDSDIRDALRVALSSIVVRVSRQESDTRYAAIENKATPAGTREAFMRAARNIESALSETWNHSDRLGRVTLINKDILTVDPTEINARISLAVTSPPYPNAYEYWLYHKYRMYWLGMDPIAVRKQEIGARPHYFKKNPQTAADFERQMSSVFALLATVIVRGGHACFQIGNSIIHGEEIDNAAIFRRVADSNDFDEVCCLLRSIPRNRKAFNLSHARIEDEKILVFRRRS